MDLSESADQTKMTNQEIVDMLDREVGAYGKFDLLMSASFICSFISVSYFVYPFGFML